MKDRTIARIAYITAAVLLLVDVLIGLGLLAGGSALVDGIVFALAVVFLFIGQFFRKRAGKEAGKAPDSPDA